MAVAIAATKVPMLAHEGVWKVLHEARTVFSMVLGLVFLLVSGAATWSLDAALLGRERSASEMTPGKMVNGRRE